MKSLLWLLAICAAAVALTLAAQHNPGYVLLVLPPRRIELSFNFFVLLLAGAFALLYLLLRLLGQALRLPAQVRAFRVRRARERAQASMLAGLRSFFEGRYARAEQAAADALAAGEAPGLNAAVAARAAHELRRYAARDGYLAQATERAPEDGALRLVTEAELLLEERRYPEALAALRRLREQGRPHTAALKLELRAHRHLGNWDQVLALSGELERRDAVDAALVRELRRSALVEGLRARAGSLPALQDYWKRVPEAQRSDARVAAAAARAFLALDADQPAQEIIEHALQQEWDAELLALFGECPGNDCVRRIERAEGWLKAHSDDAQLLLTLGRLCARQQLWGKAKSYLEASVGLADTREARVALARLAERLQQPEEARRHYQRALELLS